VALLERTETMLGKFTSKVTPPPATGLKEQPTGEPQEKTIQFGGIGRRAYSGQSRTAKKSGLESVYAYDTEKGVAFRLDYDDLRTVAFDFKDDKFVVLEFITRHVIIHGERLLFMLVALESRRVGEISAALRPEFDPKTEGIPHIRDVAIRMPDAWTSADGKVTGYRQ